MTGIPNRVKVGHLNYAVERLDRITYQGQDRLGECDIPEQTIRLLKHQCPDLEWETFWHEVLHALSSATDAALTEKQTRKLGRALTAFMFDNGYIVPETESAGARQNRIRGVRHAEKMRLRGNLG